MKVNTIKAISKTNTHNFLRGDYVLEFGRPIDLNGTITNFLISALHESGTGWEVAVEDGKVYALALTELKNNGEILSSKLAGLLNRTIVAEEDNVKFITKIYHLV